MYVVVSIVDRELGVTKFSPTFDEAMTKAVDIIVRWSIWPNIPDNFDTVRRTLENNHEYVVTDTNDGSEYAVYIGQIE